MTETLERVAELEAENILLKKREQIGVLLDNHKIVDQDLRTHFLTYAGGDLAEVDAAIVAFVAKLAQQREQGQRAAAAPAPISPGSLEEKAAMLEAQAREIRAKLPPAPPLSLDAQIAAAQKAENWKESLRLKNLKSNQLQQEAADGVKVASANSPQLTELSQRIAVAEQAQDWKLVTDLNRQKSNLLLRHGLQAR